MSPASASEALRGPIVGLEERAHVSELGRAQIGRFADGQPVIGMLRRIQRRDHRHAREAVRAVLVILPPLVEHHVALVLEFLIGQRGQQVAHAIRFHPQRQLQRVGRARPPSSWCDRRWSSRSRSRRLPAADGSSPCRDAPSPRTSGARTGARTRCGPASRSSSRRDTRCSPRRSGNRDPRGPGRPARWRGSRACAAGAWGKWRPGMGRATASCGTRRRSASPSRSTGSAASPRSAARCA